MQNYQIPQFIDYEDKVIGPLTIKQFLWLLAGGFIDFLLWNSLPLPLFLILGTLVGAFFFALAFLKINSRPLVYFLGSALNFVMRPKIHLWNKEKAPRPVFENVEIIKKEALPRVSSDKLEELAEKLDQ